MIPINWPELFRPQVFNARHRKRCILLRLFTRNLATVVWLKCCSKLFFQDAILLLDFMVTLLKLMVLLFNLMIGISERFDVISEPVIDLCYCLIALRKTFNSSSTVLDECVHSCLCNVCDFLHLPVMFCYRYHVGTTTTLTRQLVLRETQHDI